MTNTDRPTPASPGCTPPAILTIATKSESLRR